MLVPRTIIEWLWSEKKSDELYTSDMQENVNIN